MAKSKSLTIYNSDRYFNINTKNKEDISKAIKVTHSNEEQIEESLDRLAKQPSRYVLKDNKSYMLFNEKYNNDRLIEKVCKHGGEVLYYTDSVIPYYVFKDLSTNQNSQVIYRMREKFSDKEIDNIALSFMGTKVVIDISIVLPYVNPYQVIRSLHDIRTNVDEVHLTFPKLRKIEKEQEKFYYYDGEGYVLKPEYKVDFAKRIRVSLSVWKMYIYILTSEEDEQEVTEEINKLKKFKKVKL